MNLTYKTGTWGIKARERSKKRRQYFLEYRRTHPQQYANYGTSIGYRGELEGAELLNGTRNSRGVDLTVGNMKIEVKTSSPTPMNNGKGTRWRAMLSRQRGVADKFLIILKDRDGGTKATYLIPDDYFGVKKFFSVCESSLYKLERFLIERS